MSVKKTRDVTRLDETTRDETRRETQRAEMRDERRNECKEDDKCLSRRDERCDETS